LPIPNPINPIKKEKEKKTKFKKDLVPPLLPGLPGAHVARPILNSIYGSSSGGFCRFESMHLSKVKALAPKALAPLLFRRSQEDL
jgi:hypothetical protein